MPDGAEILHLSIPVRDLAEARAFSAEVLGCPVGRVRDDWVDEAGVPWRRPPRRHVNQIRNPRGVAAFLGADGEI